MDTFPELSPIRAWMRIGSIEDPDSPIGKLTDTVRDPETIIGKLSGIFGNTELMSSATGNTTSIYILSDLPRSVS